MGYTLLGLTALVVVCVCAYALYTAAKRVGRSPWLWGVLGFVFNIFAVIAFRLIVGPIMKPYS
jgi:membrane associated rhomboid family serine protease